MLYTDMGTALRCYNFELAIPVKGEKPKRIIGIINAESGLKARAHLAAFGYHGDMIKSFSSR